MTRIRWSIVIFVAGVCGVFGALGWMTAHALRLERLEVEARREARYQESLRLALWRMDAMVTPIIAREAARPFFHYQPFYAPAQAYSRLAGRAEPGEVLVPSPLLEGGEGVVRLHYQRGADGSTISPQAPPPELLDAALGAEVTGYGAAEREGEFARLVALLGASGKAGAAPPRAQAPEALATQARADVQVDQSFSEYAQRQTTVQSANIGTSRRETARRDSAGSPEPEAAGKYAMGEASPPASGREVQERTNEEANLDAEARKREVESRDEVWTGAFVPRWVMEPDGTAQLLFEREVRLGSQRVMQGFWIDWESLRGDLLGAARGLFPKAELRPLPGGVEGVEPEVLARTLAAIPAELTAEPPPLASLPLVTPVRTTLGLTWALAVAAVVVLALVLRASMELAERRGQFVSAVTHELRTPLTTFVMYSQMLADDLVRDEASRRSYIGTLRTESQRLARIVESVLDYARLSKRRRPSTVRARVTAEQVVDALAPVLRTRCEQSGMEFVLERESLLDFPVTTDPPTLERIVYNLVDNACKYAAAVEDKRVHLIARVEGRHLVLCVRDHGPGIAPPEKAHVFRAFARGAKQQDGSIPGLGLGLALAQGLARELGGDLRLAAVGGGGAGAAFEVRLPRD